MTEPAALHDPSTPPPRAATWRVELLGQVRAVSGDVVVTQFGSRKVAALLARLALYPLRAHSREELVDLLWPDADRDTGRNRLRQALATLRRVLEPPGGAEVLVADRQHLRVVPGAIACDAVTFEALARDHRGAEARALYRGELLPGHYDDWVLEDRQRLQALAERLPPDAIGQGVTIPAAVRLPAAAPARAAREPIAAEVRLQTVTTSQPDRLVLLPAYVARFFGRQAEIGQIAAQVREHRLVTLQGPGGAGKTRLSIEVARTLRGDFPVVAFVALADCERPEDIPARMRAALQLPGGGSPSDDPLPAFLADRRALLVLDNFEQLVAPGGGALLERWLQTLPGLHLLVSSRRRLEADGERSLEIAPLPLPLAGGDLARQAAVPSVALFVDRAQAVRPAFQITEHNRFEIEALCRALEGMPLAIELAASRAHALSLADMRAQMSRRFALLARKSGTRAGRAGRHASLDAALGWSWQLLDGDDQRRMAMLSVFRAGWTAAAAATVWDDGDPHEALARLVADSLVRAEAAADGMDGTDGGMRYQLLEMVREFAADRLADDDAASARARHRGWCLAMARGGSGPLSLAEVPNLLQALRTGLEDGRPDETLDLLLAAESHWERRGITPEVQALWRDALASASASASTSTSASTAAPTSMPPMATAADRAGSAVSAASAPDTAPPADTARIAAAKLLFARRLFEAGQAMDAVALVDAAVADNAAWPALAVPARALSLRLRWERAPRLDGGLSAEIAALLADASALGDRATQAELLNLLGELQVLALADADAAATSYRAALALYEALGDLHRAWDVRLGLGICAQVAGRYDEAIRIHQSVARAAADLDDQLLLVDAHNNIGVACNRARRWGEAVAAGREQLRLATRQYSRYMQVIALWNLAHPAARLRDPGLAARLIAFSATDWERQYGPLGPRDLRYVARVQRLVRLQCGAARADAWHGEGAAMTLDAAVRLALADDDAGGTACGR